MRLIPATQLSEPALVDLFNAGFSDYLLPMQLTGAAWSEHVAANDIDLACSRVVLDDEPAALALIAIRDGAGWVGGMGTTPRYRRRGMGEAALIAGLAAAGDRGAGVAWLEVIDQNQRAVRLYEKLGFQVVRDLVVWSLPARQADSSAARTRTGRADSSAARTPTGQAESPAARTIDPSSAHAWIRASRRDREPWQRADDSVAAIRARNARLRGLAIDRDGEVAAAALVRDDSPAVEVLQVVAPDEPAAAGLLLAAVRDGAELRFRNVPGDAPASLALERLGARRIATQHEMRVTL